MIQFNDGIGDTTPTTVDFTNLTSQEIINQLKANSHAHQDNLTIQDIKRMDKTVNYTVTDLHNGYGHSKGKLIEGRRAKTQSSPEFSSSMIVKDNSQIFASLNSYLDNAEPVESANFDLQVEGKVGGGTRMKGQYEELNISTQYLDGALITETGYLKDMSLWDWINTEASIKLKAYINFVISEPRKENKTLPRVKYIVPLGVGGLEFKFPINGSLVQIQLYLGFRGKEEKAAVKTEQVIIKEENK